MNRLPASFIGMTWRHGNVVEVSQSLRNSVTDDDVPEDIRKAFAALPEDGWPFIDPAFELMKKIAPEGSVFRNTLPGDRDCFGFQANGPTEG